MNGTLVAGVENKQGSFSRISCTTGIGGGPSFQYDPKKIKLKPKEALQIVVGEETNFFNLDGSGLADLDTRGSQLQLEKLVRTIIGTKAAQVNVEIPRLGTSESFSVKDAVKSLSFGKDTLVDPCEGAT